MKSKYLYQPTGVKSIDDNNVVVRNCSDRLEVMLKFSQEYFGEQLSQKTFLDIGASYGYFMNGFYEHCYRVFGIDKDNKSIRLANIFYPNVSKHIDFRIFPDEEDELKSYDIVCFLSILQHFILKGYDDQKLSEIIKVVDKKTNCILFFDMGEDHESWYKEVLFGWNAEKISKWIIQNTTFNFCVPLIRDEDSVGEFSDRYGRTLFACYR